MIRKHAAAILASFVSFVAEPLLLAHAALRVAVVDVAHQFTARTVVLILVVAA